MSLYRIFRSVLIDIRGLRHKCSTQMLPLVPPIRLCSVSGYEKRLNDVVFCPAAVKSDDPSTVVYFGGDVQDFPEVMKLHTDNKNYIKWNLENMAALLNISFPHSHILVVRPSKIEYETFSCYKNFVPSGNGGVPEHTPTHHALHHLEKLLQNVSRRIKSMSKSELKHVISSSPMGHQFYSDVDLLQVSIESLNSKLNQENVSVDIAKNYSHKDGDAAQHLSTTISPSNSSMDVNSSVSDHHVTITRKSTMDTSEIVEELNKQDSVIQLMTSTNANTVPSVVVSSQCQSAIVFNPQSMNANPSDQAREKSDAALSNALWWYDDIALDEAKLILIGFSKGCVVLNQLIYEFHYLKTLTPDDITMLNFVSRISDMFWLDGGHAGGKNTWITSRSLLETLTRLGVKIWVHVTPYQVHDDRRAYIRREEHAFTELLKKLGAQVSRTLHFDGATPDLHMHFDVLNVFRNADNIIGQPINK